MDEDDSLVKAYYFLLLVLIVSTGSNIVVWVLIFLDIHGSRSLDSEETLIGLEGGIGGQSGYGGDVTLAGDDESVTLHLRVQGDDISYLQ